MATQRLGDSRELSESWRVLRERYAVLLVDRLELNGQLREVAIHALHGGKRLRPMLAELLGRALSAPPLAVTEVAIAVEYLHTASMMLDDLPCMDAAATRRGAPSAHVRFSEPEAILSALALVSRAYAILLLAPIADARAMALLAAETVASTMAPGQAMEFARGPALSGEAIERIHDKKTASLFALTGRLVAKCAGASAGVTETVVAFTTLFGQAYQIMDDIEDRDEPGEARANLARMVKVEVAKREARARLAAASHAITDIDPWGGLGACIAWLEQRLDGSA